MIDERIVCPSDVSISCVHRLLRDVRLPFGRHHLDCDVAGPTGDRIDSYRHVCSFCAIFSTRSTSCLLYFGCLFLE